MTEADTPEDSAPEQQANAQAKDSAPDPSDAPAEDSFASYLAKRFIGDIGFQPGVPEEALPLVKRSDYVLSFADFALTLICIIDRVSDPKKRFKLSQEKLVEIGKECLRYTGSMHGTKMPVVIKLYEVGEGPPTEEDQQRMRALQRTMPGLTKVAIGCTYLDIREQTVWSSAPFLGRLRDSSHQRWLRRVLTEPRKKDSEIFQPEAAIPQRDARPLVTIGILGVLAAAFVLEQVVQSGHKGPGLLGIDAGTLFALGGMNSDAVLKQHEWYRLPTAALLHVDAFHLVFNGLALFLAGLMLESLLGPAWLLVLFFVGAIGGSSMGLAVNPESMVSVGASGAVMGLLAAAFVTAYRYPPGAARSQVQVSMLQFLIPSLIPLAISRHGERIDYAAHFGGAIAGAVAGYLLLRIWPRESPEPRFKGASFTLAGAAVVAFALSATTAKAHFPNHAAAVDFSVEELLVEQSKIPTDMAQAKSEVETWGKDSPRDPRVHFFRALRLLDENKGDEAVRELNAALAEREILERAFPDKKLENMTRFLLAQVLVQQGKEAEAKQAAAPSCKTEHADELRKLGVCE